jgi:NADH dehydrogenase
LEDHLFDLAKNDFYQDGASTFVVVGSGFAGLEAVTAIEQKARAIQTYHSGKEMNFRIVMLESHDERETLLSKECLRYIQDILASRNVEVLSNHEISAIETASVLLEDGTRISTMTVVWTEGLFASPLTQFFDGDKDHRNRLLVNNFLKLPSYSNVVAPGSIASIAGTSERISSTTGRYAQFEGRWAGHNAVNDLYGIRMTEYVAPAGDACVDLGDSQTVYPTDWEQNLKIQRDRQRAAERRMNSVSMFPWQDVEETIKSSYPEFPGY